VLSLGVKAVFVVLTFAGAATLWAAIAADMGVSLIVIANALRLLRVWLIEKARGDQRTDRVAALPHCTTTVPAQHVRAASGAAPGAPTSTQSDQPVSAATNVPQLTRPKTSAMIPPRRFAFRRYHMM
jgi:hypothetical protein